MLKFIRNSLRWILGGSFTLLIAACYGVPANYMQKDSAVKCTDKNQKPISDLEITLIGKKGKVFDMKTEQDGKVNFSLSSMSKGDYMIEIVDKDGKKNGGSFKKTVISNIDFYNLETNYNITLEEE